jgi:dihydroflavonol-4-reductase
VQGPGRSTGTARILVGFLTGELRLAVDADLSIVYVDDCVEGHLLAEQRGEPGERYLLNGATLSVRDAVAVLEGITGLRRRVRYLPAWAVRAGAAAVGLGSRLLRRDEAPFCPEMARALLHGHCYDGSKATRELGLTYTPIEEALLRTVEWLRRTGLV